MEARDEHSWPQQRARAPVDMKAILLATEAMGV
jgi:hypothetical protein